MKYFFILYLFSIFSEPILAQHASISAGGNIQSSNGGSISYTLGQIAYVTIASSEKSFAEGVQQVYSLSATSTDNTSNSSGYSIDCIIFPNPTSDNITLSINGSDLTSFKYYLYNSSRKLIKLDNIQSSSTVISMVDLPTGVYLLTVCNSKKNIMRIFKIIKDFTLQ